MSKPANKKASQPIGARGFFYRGLAGSSGRTRTYNQPVNSRSLCLLSYRGISIDAANYTNCALFRQVAFNFQVLVHLPSLGTGGQVPRSNFWVERRQRQAVAPAPRFARIGYGEDGARDTHQVIGDRVLQSGVQRLRNAGDDGG